MNHALAGLDALLEQGQEHWHKKPWPLSATLLTRMDGQWQVFQAEGEVTRRARDLQRVSSAVTYADQKSALEEVAQKTNNDIFVATFGIMCSKSQHAEARSWWSWAESVRSSLPKTDVVVLNRDRSKYEISQVILPWETMVSLLGHRLTAEAEDPPRFYVDSFPDDTEWLAVVTASDAPTA